MMRTLLLMLHRVVDRIAALLGRRRDWWSVFLARLPLSLAEMRRFGLRTYKHAEDEIEEIATRPSDVDLSHKDRRLSASVWLKMNRVSVPVKPEFELHLPHPYSRVDDRGHFADVLTVKYLIEPHPSRLVIFWNGVVREWSVPPARVEVGSPPPEILEEVCETWNAIRCGRLVRLQMKWIEPWDGYYDHHSGPPVKGEVRFLPREEALRWRDRWMGDERCLIYVQITDWREKPIMMVERPFADADRNAITVFAARQANQEEK